MSDATQTQTLEQTLNKTDLGHMIYENRKIFIAAIVAVFVVVTGYVLFQQTKKNQQLELSLQVHEFASKTWDSAKGGKLALPELVSTFNALDKDVQSSPLMVPVALEMGKFMADKGAYAEADAVLSKVNVTHPVTSFFVAMQRAVILEKMNKIPDAIAVLEEIAKNKEVLMAAKVNLELGRLNLALGEKGKAQTHFDYILNTFPNDEYAKLAKLYLAKLAQ